MRCLGSPQHLRTKYGDGFQVEIDMIVPSLDQITHQCDVLNNLIDALAIPPMPKKALSENFSLGSSVHSIIDTGDVTKEQIEHLFFNQNDDWRNRLSHDGTASDLLVSLEHNGSVAIKHLASWWLLELRYDNITAFLNDTFGSYTLHERQVSKLRVELSGKDHEAEKGTERKLSYLFGAIEEKRDELHIQGYSIAQTSLEQIFNHFAAQQEEETGLISGMVANRT